MAHRIWVCGLVRQSDPAEAIFRPGRAWGMPYAPEPLDARGFQPLSRLMMWEKQAYCVWFPIICFAMDCGLPLIGAWWDDPVEGWVRWVGRGAACDGLRCLGRLCRRCVPLVGGSPGWRAGT